MGHAKFRIKFKRLMGVEIRSQQRQLKCHHPWIFVLWYIDTVSTFSVCGNGGFQQIFELKIAPLLEFCQYIFCHTYLRFISWKLFQMIYCPFAFLEVRPSKKKCKLSFWKLTWNSRIILEVLDFLAILAADIILLLYGINYSKA